MAAPGAGLLVFAGGVVPVLWQVSTGGINPLADKDVPRRILCQATSLSLLFATVFFHYTLASQWVSLAFLFAYAVRMCFCYSCRPGPTTHWDTFFEAIFPVILFIGVYTAHFNVVNGIHGF